MEKYLSKKYSNYSQDSKQKPFTFEHVKEELLCSSITAQTHIKETLKRGYQNLNFEQFSTVVSTAIDLD